MDLHANAVLTIRQRLTITAAALVVCCSRQAASKWVNRRRRGESLADRSSRPRRSPRRTPAVLKEAILRAREELREGPHVIGWALGAGVAYAATQMASSDGTQVCVNQTNGLMRASSMCREGEYAMTIGGGSDVVVTQNGTFTVAVGTTGTSKTLPLTGVTVAGYCQLQTPPPPMTESGLARIVLAMPSGTMDAFASSGAGGNVGTIGGTSLTTGPAAAGGGSAPGTVAYGVGSATVTANGATATITFGAHVDPATKTCAYLWQATEAPN